MMNSENNICELKGNVRKPDNETISAPLTCPECGKPKCPKCNRNNVTKLSGLIGEIQDDNNLT
jgi:hypothetical protein